MRILGGSASRPSPRTSLFSPRARSPRGRDHGPREDSIELSSGGEAYHRRPPVLRSDRFGGLRPSSVRRDPAGLLGGRAQPVHVSGAERPEGPRPDRADGRPLPRWPPRIGRASRLAALRTLRDRRSALAPGVSVLFPVPFEHRELPLAEVRAPRPAPPGRGETPIADPGLSEGSPRDDRPAPRGYLLRDGGDGRGGHPRRVFAGTAGPPGGRLPRCSCPCGEDERDSQVGTEGPRARAYDGLQASHQEGVRARPTQIRTDDLRGTSRPYSAGAPLRSRPRGHESESDRLPGNGEANRFVQEGQGSPRRHGTGPSDGGESDRGYPRDARGDPTIRDRARHRDGPLRGAGEGNRDPSVLSLRHRGDKSAR